MDFPTSTRIGETNPETELLSDKVIIRQMATAVYHLSLAYYFLDEPKYAQKAISFINTWFVLPQTRMNPNLDYGQCVPGTSMGKPYGIIDSRWLILVADALKILKSTGSLGQATEMAMENWFRSYLDWLLESSLGQQEAHAPNNHGSWYYAQVAVFADFIGNRSLLLFALNDSKQFFNSQIDSVGRQQLELHRTKSYDYSLYNIHALITLAKLAEINGIDIWHHEGEKGQGLEKSIMYLAHYFLENEPWPYEQIAEKSIQLSYGDGLNFSVYYPYDLYSAVLVGYSIYENPYFEKCVQKIQAQGGGKHTANLLIDFAERK